MPVTVRKILDLDIFKTKTRLVAGANGLDNVITYITIMESPDFYEWVNGGEFVLTTWYAYSQHPELQVPGFRRLAEKIAAIGIKIGRHINEVPPEIITIANEYAVPVFAINRETKHREIIQAVAAELNNYQTNLLLEVNKHYLELARIALAGGDFTPMLRGLGRRMGVPCFCLNQDFRVLGSYLPEGHGRVNLPALAEQVRQVINQAPNGSLYHQIKDLHIFTCTARQQPVGYLVLVTPQKLSKKNELMANQLVTFLTLKLFDQLDTEQKILISLWDDILYKRYLSEPQLRERLSLYGLKAYHAFQVVVLLQSPHAEHDPKQAYELSQLAYYVRNLLQPALLINKTNEIIVICDNTSAQPWQKPRWVKQLSEHFRERKGLAAVVSVGPSVANALKIESSYRLAKQTAKIALSLGETGVKHYADFLGPSLLLRALGTPEHEYLQDQVITPLREYDRQYHNDLLPTLLAAIFAPDLNTVAAELNVHVNTVRYRLEKIAAITGYDFFTVRDKFTLTTAALLELNGSKK